MNIENNLYYGNVLYSTTMTIIMYQSNTLYPLILHNVICQVYSIETKLIQKTDWWLVARGQQGKAGRSKMGYGTKFQL